MSCLITAGRSEQCKDTISGIQAAYFINFGIAPEDVTYNVVGGEEDEILTIANVSTIYKFELKGANMFDQTINSSRANGTTFFTQSLTMQMKRQDVEMHRNIKNIAYGRPHVIIHTRNNLWFLMGLTEGADVSAGKISTGQEYADFAGYELTLEANEKIPANFLACTSETELATNVLGGATIVTDVP